MGVGCSSLPDTLRLLRQVHSSLLQPIDLSFFSALQILQAMVKESTAFHRCLYQLPSGALVTKSFPVLSQTFASSAPPSYEMPDPYWKFLTDWGDGSLGKASTIPVFM